MSDLIYTRHAETRTQQRGIRKGDIRVILEFGTLIDKDTWLLRSRDVAREIENLKREIQFLSRLRNRKVVICGERVITAYPSRPLEQKPRCDGGDRGGTTNLESPKTPSRSHVAITPPLRGSRQDAGGSPSSRRWGVCVVPPGRDVRNRTRRAKIRCRDGRVVQEDAWEIATTRGTGQCRRPIHSRRNVLQRMGCAARQNGGCQVVSEGCRARDKR